MIVLLLALAGALWGAFLARSRGGRRLDIAQYAAAFAIIGALIGMFVTIYLSRMMA
jgi:UPF0716 family protein affecting phage T7 exclusion